MDWDESSVLKFLFISFLLLVNSVSPIFFVFPVLIAINIIINIIKTEGKKKQNSVLFHLKK